VNGMSGTGVVAEGIQFRDGSVAYKWLTSPGTLQYAETADGVEAVQHIHGHGGKTSIRYMDDNNDGGEAKTISEVYEDRNRLAVAFASLAAKTDYDGGWMMSDADDADAAEWAIVWAETPAGQVSWHVPHDMVNLTNLKHNPYQWDGHDRMEKNDRLLDVSKL
jgi:hypothetical protein